MLLKYKKMAVNGREQQNEGLLNIFFQV